MKNIFIVLMILLFAGCATEAGYQRALNSYVGVKESDLVDNWGIPDGTYQSGKIKYLIYKDDRYKGFYCKTTFIIEGGFVRNWEYEGNRCRSSN